MFGVVHAGVGYECTPTPVQTRLLYGNSFEAEIVWSTHTARHSTSFAIQLATNSQPQRYASCLTWMTDRHTCKHTGTESTPTLSLLLRLACVSTPLSHLPCQVAVRVCMLLLQLCALANRWTAAPTAEAPAYRVPVTARCPRLHAD